MSVLEQINTAKPEEMSDIIMAVRERYGELFPDWDLQVIALEKAVDKNAQLDQIIALMERLKE